MQTTNKTIGVLLIAGAIALLIPYSWLTIIFEYPAILRQGTSVILTKFHEGGSTLVWTWFAFAITGLPLIPAYILLGQILENKSPFVRVATTIGLIGLVVQIVGLLRWTFVVPVLADTYVNSTDVATKVAVVVAFQTIHQFAGVILGEHLGQLFTIIWTVLMTIAFAKLRMMPSWINGLGLLSSAIYLMAQAELFATVLPGVPIWDMAGFVGSTLWLLWLISVGFRFVTSNPTLLFTHKSHSATPPGESRPASGRSAPCQS